MVFFGGLPQSVDVISMQGLMIWLGVFAHKPDIFISSHTISGNPQQRMQVCISDWLCQQRFITASISRGEPHNQVFFFLPPRIDVVRFCKMEGAHSPGFLLS